MRSVACSRERLRTRRAESDIVLAARAVRARLCRCRGTRRIAEPVYDAHRRYMGARPVPCGECAR